MSGLNKVKTLPDKELVARFARGDRDAFAEIVRRYQRPVFGTCLRWIGDRTIAEEVAQDVFLAVFRALHTFRGESQFSTWLFRITINHCKNRRLYRHRRAVGRHDPIAGPTDDDDSSFRELPAPGPGTDESTHRHEAEHLIEGALQHLDDDYRSVVVLRDIQDLTYEEISSILNIPRGTVKSRLHRARTQLAQILRRTLSHEDIL